MYPRDTPTILALQIYVLLVIIFLLVLFYSELARMFQSWADIEKHWTAIKFACGLQQDSSGIVDYVCKRFSEMWLHMMRRRGIYNVSELSLGRLIELSQEMREKKNDPLQTEHFSFITDIPMKRRSKLYVFGPNYCGRSDHCTVTQ